MDGELWPPGTPGIEYPYGQFPSGPVARGEVSEELWNILPQYGWTLRFEGGGAQPATLPTKGPVMRHEVSAEVWGYLLYIGWRKNNSGVLFPPGTPDTYVVYPIPAGAVTREQVGDAQWDWLTSEGAWTTRLVGTTETAFPPERPTVPGTSTPAVQRLYPPPQPLVVSPAFGSATIVTTTSAKSGAMASTIAADSKRSISGQWRYIAQRATTGEFLDFDLPLSRDEITWELSGPGCLRGTISPDRGLLRAEDGHLLLEEWGTIIYAEADGEIRWGGILVNSGWEGSRWSIECAGFACYPNGQPYNAEYQQTGADPGEIIRHIWEHLQSYADGNLNVRVTNSITGAMVGLPKGPVLPEQVPAAVWNYLQRANWTRRQGDDSERIYPPGYDGDIPAKDTSDPLDPYELFWWEAPDCGSAIDNLVRDTPLDYVERHAWDPYSDLDTVKHEIQISYPRAGRRRMDLAFIQGDNVVSVVAPSTDGEFFANNILGLGAGEGSGSVRTTTGLSDGRLRRVAVYPGKDLASVAQLDSAIAAELRRRQAILVIDSIDVRDHPNAPIGSWALGDDILVRADIPWLGEIELWCRITGWTLTSDTTATLKLARSDAFSYAATTVQAEDGPITGNDDPVPYPSDTTWPSDRLFPNDPEHA